MAFLFLKPKKIPDNRNYFKESKKRLKIKLLIMLTPVYTNPIITAVESTPSAISFVNIGRNVKFSIIEMKKPEPTLVMVSMMLCLLLCIVAKLF